MGKEPVHVGIGSVDEGLAANQSIRQEVEVLHNEKDKPTRLLSILKQHYAPGKKIMIFGLYKKEISWLENFLWEKGYDKVIALQGDMSQATRTQAIEDFKATKKTPLIATDVASRGLDVQDVELVINYTFPLTIEDYVHRIGRTGRAGKKGLAVCFFCPDSKGAQDEKAHAGDLSRSSRTPSSPCPQSWRRSAAPRVATRQRKRKPIPSSALISRALSRWPPWRRRRCTRNSKIRTTSELARGRGCHSSPRWLGTCRRLGTALPCLNRHRCRAEHTSTLPA